MAAALAGDRTLESIHPDYLGELSAGRLGIQTGAKMTAYNFPGEKTLTVAECTQCRNCSRWIRRSKTFAGRGRISCRPS